MAELSISAGRIVDRLRREGDGHGRSESISQVEDTHTHSSVDLTTESN